jgi:putative spermidine/putrescine transport system substrate-binding protein
MPRMTWFGLPAAVAAALVLAGCGAPESGEGKAGKSSADEIVVGSAGGQADNLIKEFTIPALEKVVGKDAPKVTLDGANFIGRPTMVVAEKGAAKGTYDAVQVTDTGMARLISAGALMRLDTSKISNWANVQEQFRNDYCAPAYYSAETIIYHSEHVDRPSSWGALWDAKYKGKVGVVASMYQYAFFAASALEAKGEPGKDWVAGAGDRIQELGPNVRVYASNDQLGQALATGEVWMTYNRKARGALWAEFDASSPLKTVVPSEGTMPTTFYYCIPKNAPHPEEAHAFLNAVLEPSSQLGMAQGLGYAPTVDDADLTPQLQEAIGFTDDEKSRTYAVDWDSQQEQAKQQDAIWQKHVVKK